VTLRRERPAAVRASLNGFRRDVEDFLHDVPTRPSDIVDRIDTLLRRYAELVVAAGTFGMVRSGWGELLAWRRSVFGDALAAVAATAERMARSLAAADALVAENAALPRTASDEDQFRLLQSAERLLTTKPTSPRPARPAQLLNAVRDARRRFNSRLQGL